MFDDVKRREAIHDLFDEQKRYLEALCPGWARVYAVWHLMKSGIYEVKDDGTLGLSKDYGGE
jgi:hypothetical protein